jgi:hypothetical protein
MALCNNCSKFFSRGSVDIAKTYEIHCVLLEQSEELQHHTKGQNCAFGSYLQLLLPSEVSKDPKQLNYAEGTPRDEDGKQEGSLRLFVTADSNAADSLSVVRDAPHVIFQISVNKAGRLRHDTELSLAKQSRMYIH